MTNFYNIYNINSPKSNLINIGQASKSASGIVIGVAVGIRAIPFEISGRVVLPSVGVATLRLPVSSPAAILVSVVLVTGAVTTYCVSS